jgi:restriction system protein
MSEAMWMVRAGREGAYADEFIEGNFVAIGFVQELGAAALGLTKRELLDKLAATHPDWSDGKSQTVASQFVRFNTDVQIGDRIVTYDPGRRRYVIGRVPGPTVWQQGSDIHLPYRRAVEWKHSVAREALSVPSRNTLGAIQTLFRVSDEAAADLEANPGPLDAPAPPVKEAPPAKSDTFLLRQIRDNMLEQAAEFIEDRIAQLDPYEMQELVAGLLRALGYKTRVSPKGSDRGIDIFASPDGLGLQEPRIFVEVKHRRNSVIGANDVRSFLGGRKASDRCLYVSTGGFTKEARYEAERAATPLTLIDLPELRRLVVDHYERLDEETKQLVPLRRVYWPIEEEE